MPRTMDDLRAEQAAAEHAAWAKRHGMGKPDPALASHAAMRTRLHDRHRSQRILSDDSEYVGLAGERALADHLGIAMDTDLKPSGNGGVNAVVNGHTLNVYTYRKPYNLLVEQGKATADVYVLAAYDEATGEARLLPRCWATKEEVLSQTPRDVGGMGVVSHAIPARALRELSELIGYLGVRRAGDQPALF